MSILIESNNCLRLTGLWPDNFAPEFMTVRVNVYDEGIFILSEPEAYVEVFGSVISEKSTLENTEAPGIYEIRTNVEDVGEIKKIVIYFGQDVENVDVMRPFSIADISFYPEPICNKLPLTVLNCSFSDKNNHCYLPNGMAANRTPTLYREYTDYDLDNKPWEYTRSDKLGIRFLFDDDADCLDTTSGCTAPSNSVRLEGEGEAIMILSATSDATIKLDIDSSVTFTNGVDFPHFADVRLASFDDNCALSAFELISEMTNSQNDLGISTCLVGNKMFMSMETPNKFKVEAGKTYILSFRVHKYNVAPGGCGSYIAFEFEKEVIEETLEA